MGVIPYFEVGTERFDSLLNKITSQHVLDGGQKLDKSALYHGHGEKILIQFDYRWI